MRKLIVFLILASLLPACGQKGPLYLPQQKPAAGAPAAAPAAGTQAEDRKQTAPSGK